MVVGLQIVPKATQLASWAHEIAFMHLKQLLVAQEWPDWASWWLSVLRWTQNPLLFIIMYEDNQACMDILAANQVTSRVKHIAVPIAYCHEQIRAIAVKPVKVYMSLQVSDIGNKPNSSTLYHRHKDTLFGKRFYPRPHTRYTALLDQWMGFASEGWC